MVEHIYIERDLVDHPRVTHVRRRFPAAEVVLCERYAEVFNRTKQNFRLQKNKPALILAQKSKSWVLPTPSSFGIGGTRNFYFSHLLNCVYDCRYCFLQGMYRSANYVLFVNYDDYRREIVRVASEGGTPATFFSGYDCDSMALESVTGFAEFFLPVFGALDNAQLELRTKSVNIRVLLDCQPMSNVIVAFSMTPKEISESLEHGVPTLSARILAMKKLATAGWSLGLRLDPLIYAPNFREQYAQLLELVFTEVDPEEFHSVSIGPLRFPKPMFDRVVELYPREPVLAGPLARRGTQVSYPADLEQEMMDYCRVAVGQWVDINRIFSCMPEVIGT